MAKLKQNLSSANLVELFLIFVSRESVQPLIFIVRKLDMNGISLLMTNYVTLIVFQTIAFVFGY